MVEIYVQEVVLGINNQPTLSNGYKIFVRTRKHVLGYMPHSEPAAYGFTTSHLSREQRKNLQDPKNLLGRVFVSRKEVYWIYTNSSGVISIILIPYMSWRDALELSEICHTPMPPTELMFMLELTSGR